MLTQRTAGSSFMLASLILEVLRTLPDGFLTCWCQCCISLRNNFEGVLEYFPLLSLCPLATVQQLR